MQTIMIRIALGRCWAVAAIALALLAAAPAVAVAADATPAKPAEPIVMAYLGGWHEPDVAHTPWNDLTHICQAFVRANADGSLSMPKYMPDPALIEAAHAHGVKVLASIGGSDSDAVLSPMARDPRKLDRFIAGVIKLVKDNGYDGIDLDWEFPLSKASADAFTEATHKLRAAIDKLEADTGRTYLLTRAVGGAWAYRNVPTSVFRDDFDYLNIMGYDRTGPWSDIAGHHAALTAPSLAPDAPTVKQLVDYWMKDRGIPASKLLLGMPAYGRGFHNVKEYGHVAKHDPGDTEYTYAQLAEKQRGGWTLTRNDNGAPWLISPDGAERVGFDDPTSIAMKTRWALGHGMAGVFLWELPSDRMPDGSHPLVHAAAEAARHAP